MKINFEKGKGLVPVVIQDSVSLTVLMVGYMNEEAWLKTQQEKRVTFFSRSRNTLWTKGETSGNYLNVVEMVTDCDNDSLLIKVIPEGQVCHKGTLSCFDSQSPSGFLYQLEKVITERISRKTEGSYTYKLFSEGLNRMAQKVGEEAVEVVIAAKDEDTARFKDEAADLLYHLLILLKAKETSMAEIEQTLSERHNKRG
ncbi:MAG: bifunctional phosphoribosyl-AMP cyclohydrolase/phosphoribosyl-ATP diphosphatase HisIE [Bacteroidales bacterium]|jgi:phosphoribosyl-ATP pyrophosphohydrolase/phosphoribosyl-AMP cyclohydrolase